MALNEMNYRNRIVAHYENTWNNEGSIYLWDKGPVERLPYNFRILEFPPNERRNMWTYATCCMSTLEDAVPIEVHIFSSSKDESIIELLTSLAYYHRQTSLVGLNHTVNFGRPWQGMSLCSYGFISLPYLDGPNLEDLYLNEEERLVKFYWLIPITEREAKFKAKNGVGALEEKFDKGLNYLDSNRKSLV